MFKLLQLLPSLPAGGNVMSAAVAVTEQLPLEVDLGPPEMTELFSLRITSLFHEVRHI